MKTSRLYELQKFGQSIWLDYLGRGLMDSGELARFIEQDALRGVTSNPSIFEKSIAGTHDYDTAIRDLALAGKTPAEIYEALTVEDVGRAADLFRHVYYEDSRGRDGFVSLEVSPHLAHDTAGTIAEARHLWARLDRPNVMIKIPATREGLPAIRRCLAEGINVNVTLLFSLSRYREVAQAYLSALEDRVARREDVAQIQSVASFFLSRIDTLVDPMIEKIAAAGGPKADLARSLTGQTAVASAKGAYRIFKSLFSGDRFLRLLDHGATTQRVLWASTSTKNPAYPDLVYVEPLVGPDTVNTVPLETLVAFRDHGRAGPTLEADLDRGAAMLDCAGEVGIDMVAVADQLESEGVKKFEDAYDSLLKAIAVKAEALRTPAGAPG
jgi:transaldolase